MRCAIVLNVPISPAPESQGANGDAPRKDYRLLAESLNAEIIAGSPDPSKRQVPRRLSYELAQAWHVFRRRDEFDVIFSMSEQVGLWVALLLRLARCQKPHIMITHYLTPKKKGFLFFRLLRVQSHITKFICYGSAQAAFLRKELRIADEKVELVLHPADARFWHPMPVPTDNLVASAGMSGRDYPTLVKAVADIDAEVVIAAASPWATSANKGQVPDNLPGTVKTVQCTPKELRDLYARSRFVVVPLRTYNCQTGSMVIYEAMAMGKAVVTTDNGGQVDIIEEGVTGHYTPPGDAVALRQVIIDLLKNPKEAQTMGAEARQVVEQGLNMDIYVEKVSHIVREVWRQNASEAVDRQKSKPAEPCQADDGQSIW